MKTVKDLITMLESMNPNAVICTLDIDGGSELGVYFDLEICREQKNAEYVNREGKINTSDIVIIY